MTRAGHGVAALAAQDGSGEAFPNGVDVTRYVGGDGSFQKHHDEGIRLGLIEADPVNFTDADGKRAGERIEIIDFTLPVFWYGDALFVQKGNPANLHSWDALAGKSVGVVLGANNAEWLQERTDLGVPNTSKDTSS